MYDSNRFGLGENVFGMRVTAAPLPTTTTLPTTQVVIPKVTLPPTPGIDYVSLTATLRQQVTQLSADLKASVTKVSELSALTTQLTTTNVGLETDLKKCRDELLATNAAFAELEVKYNNSLVKIAELEAANVLNAETAAAAYAELNKTLMDQITQLQADLDAAKLLAAEAAAEVVATETKHAAKLKEFENKKTNVVPIALAAAAAYFAFKG